MAGDAGLLLQLYEWKLKHYQEWAAKKLGPQYARLLLVSRASRPQRDACLISSY